MLTLNKKSIQEKKKWVEAEITLPDFDYEKLVENTTENPTWVHFGAGNIFRGFTAVLQQKLLNEGKATTGIIAAETFDFEIIDKAYAPYDNLNLLVIMKADGKLEKTVIGSITEGLVADVSREKDWNRLKDVFSKPSLQMVSFTITEKGYNLKKISGDFFDNVIEDMKNGPKTPNHAMSKAASLAYERFKNGQLPIAFVSMDNCSHNGEKLHNSMKTIIEKWVENNLVEAEFLDYINDTKRVSFPWSMIDKITPRPSEFVKNSLNKIGFGDTEIICTSKNTFIAPFVNAEGPQYLVIEDNFPNGRMPLEEAGVLFANKETVNKVEKMKVCTCLNPLHTALAVYGCLLGYNLIADEMKDNELKKLVEKIGYEEGLPVVVNPGIINPLDFIKEVLEERLPNPFIPDTPQRIACDTSQKVGIRFGETIKAYEKDKTLNPETLKFIPLAIAGWCRYLLGTDDKENIMELSSDPMLDVLKSYVSEIELGNPDSVGNKLVPILSNENIFGINLYKVNLGTKIENYFKELIAGENAVRNTLKKHLGSE